MNILITGITGFLGRNLVSYILDKNPKCKIVGTGHSESKYANFKKLFPGIEVLIIDLSSDKFENEIDFLIKKYKIDYMIHIAAMKHVDICQQNPISAIHVNTLATDKLIKISKKNDIKNMIAISTDKANNPRNIYGMTKYLMQELVLQNNYSIFQGANFFWSDASVLEIWYNQFIKKQPLTVRNIDHIRYFNIIEYVCEKIYDNLDNKGIIIVPDHVYVIKLKELLDAFCEVFNYYDVKYTAEYDFEKNVEEFKNDIINKVVLTKKELIALIQEYNQKQL